MSETAQRRPRTWVLWVVRATLALTVIHVGVGAIASTWLGKASTDSALWLVMALPQVSIALLAILICWDRDSRPPGLGITAGMLNSYGLMFAVIFWKWPLMVIGALTILAMVVRPREWIFSGEPPPRFVRLRNLWSTLTRS